MIRLHVNVDHVATLRQQRDTIYPDPVLAAGLCELAGADGITAHLREDRRHIQERDVRLLRQTVRGVLNLEMAAVPSIVDIALEIKPDFCTLVPEKRQERTTEGGLDLRGQGAVIGKAVRTLRDAGIGVSLFIDPRRMRRGPAPILGPFAPSYTPDTTATPPATVRTHAANSPGWRRRDVRWQTPVCAWRRGTASTTPTSLRWRRYRSWRS